MVAQEWPYLAITCPPADLDAVEEWLAEVLLDVSPSYRGLRQEDGEAPTARLVLTFADRQARDRVRDLFGGPGSRRPASVRCAEAGTEADRDWVAEVGATVAAVAVGKAYAALPGDVAPLTGRRSIRVPRSRAFGTGEHPSTRLAAGLLESVAGDASAVLDVGTGTGILAMLARLEGTGAVVALDNDPVAARLAAGAVAANDIDGLDVICGTVDCLLEAASFTVVVANLERDPLLAILPRLEGLTATGGSLILSGLLDEQAEELVVAARNLGLVEVARCSEAGWTAIHLSPRPATQPRILVDPGAVSDGRVVIPPQEARHLRARRAVAGERVEVIDGQGGAWRGRVAESRETVDDLVEVKVRSEARLQVVVMPAVLHQAGPMEAIIRQATEMGAQRIAPVVTQRCQGGERRRSPALLRRWRRIAAESLKQCGRVQVPEVDVPRPLSEVLGRHWPGRCLLFDPSGRPSAAVLAAAAPHRVQLLLGPEGGWTKEELAAARQAGFEVVSMGPRILRGDTAVVAALTLILTAWGDLSRPVDLPFS